MFGLKTMTLLNAVLASQLLAVTLFVNVGCSQPPVEVGEKAAPETLTSIKAVEHQAYDELLAKYVDAKGNVDYTGWKASSADMAKLDQYLADLSKAEPSREASEADKLAFWINAYNALTLKGILNEYPTTSIKNHVSRIGGYNIWKDFKMPVGAKQYSLDEIEHQVLRKMGEPRIHFAIVCASTSCPALRNEAYVADKLEAQLSDNSRRFFASPLNFQSDARSRTLHLSAILQWFGEDFGANETELLATISPYLPTDADRSLAADPGVGVKYLGYDWSLNDQK